MRQSKTLALFTLGSALLLSACQSTPILANRGPVGPLQAFNAPRAVAPLVAVTGLKNGDKLKVKGPLWYKGEGQVHNITPDAFKLEFAIASHHLIVEAVRIDATKARFTTIDIKNNRTVEVIGTYSQSGPTTIFDMGQGAEVEKLTVRAGSPGTFEADVVQPSLQQEMQDRGSTTLKFSKG